MVEFLINDFLLSNKLGDKNSKYDETINKNLLNIFDDKEFIENLYMVKYLKI